MKISLSTHQFLDDEGRPLASGRITVYLHGSDTPADLYTMEGDEYVQADNPVTCYEDGRIPTLFFEASVVDVKVEKSNLDGTYELLDTYEDGFDFASARNDTVFHGIGSLHEANTEVGVVSVVGYDDDVYAPQRTYVWDPTCTELADDGVIVESDTTDTGRWILLWDDEKLPCTVYGIVPGKESNISAFLTYPDSVGQWSIRTPRIPRFLSGDYTSSTTFTASRTLYFDDGARFPQAKFVCNRAMIPSNSGYVADMYFTDHESVAHSSWFRTIDAFLTCNASRLVVDSTNYFAGTSISYNRELSNVILEYPTNTRLPITYIGGGKLTLSRVSIIGEDIFDSTDILAFKYTDVTDKWWSSPASIDWVNKVNARSSALNTLRLENFTNVTAYVNAIRANGATELDLAGRKVSTLDASGFTEIRNTNCNTLSISSSNLNVTLHNVKSTEAYIACNQLTIRDGSDITVAMEPAMQAIWVEDSRISSMMPWSAGKQIIARNSVWNVVLHYASDNETGHGLVELTDCDIAVNVGFRLKNITMKGCRTSNSSIKIYPVHGADGYTLSCTLIGNTFSSNYPIEFTKFDELDPSNNVYDCTLNWSIMDNVFLGNEEGMRCRYWAQRSGAYWNRTFVKMGATHSITYSGNTGRCPAADMKGVQVSDNRAYTTETVSDSGTVYKYRSAWRRAVPTAASQWWSQDTVEFKGTMVKWYSWVNDPYDSLSYDLFFQVTWMPYFYDHDEQVENGDFFKLGVLVFGDYIRIVQRGDGDHNQGVLARII